MYKLILHIVLAVFLSAQAHAQWWQCTVEPVQPSGSALVTIVLSGEWGNCCVPNDSYMSVAGNTIHFDAFLNYPPDIFCCLAITPWSLSETIGPLPSGAYTVEATLYDRSGIPVVGPTPACNFTVKDAPDFEYRCTILEALSSTNQTTTPPESVAEVYLGDTFCVEFWGTDSGTTNTGLVSVYADMDYAEDLVSCGATTNSTLFPFFTDGICDGAIIDELGGSQLAGGLGADPEWARVASVEFSAGVAGVAGFVLNPAHAESSAFNSGLVPPADISYGSCSVLIRELGACCNSGDTCTDDMKEDECIALNGTYLGDGVACADDPDRDNVWACDDICPTSFSPAGVDSEGRPLGDFDGDCDVDLIDFGILQGNFSGPGG